MGVQLMVCLLDGTKDYIEKECDEWDVIADLNRHEGIFAQDTWYPKHAIAKLKIIRGREDAQGAAAFNPDEDWRRYEEAVAEYRAKRKKRR